MGICWPLCVKRRPQRRIVLILIGLDNAGKTQTVNSLSGVEESIMPTVGFKAVNLVHRDTPVTIYDIGGGAQIRQIWSQYYSEIHGIIFVVDSSDGSRMEECRAALHEVISHERIAGKPILILANKQDKRGALDDIDIVEKLGIERLVNRFRCPTLVESYSAAVPEYMDTSRKKKKLDPGLKKGYTWLLNFIIHHYGDINLRVQSDIHAELERRKRQSAQNHLMSETYVRDEEILETGFENPNYVTMSRDSTLETEAEDIENFVLVVKPIVCKSSEENTFESATESESQNAQNDVTVENIEDIDEPMKSSQDDIEEPKLSPLFGRKNEENVPKPIQLEARKTLSKLNPIIRLKMPSAFERKIPKEDIRSRPQSSPSVKVVRVKTEIEMNEIDDTTFTEIDLRENGIMDIERVEVKPEKVTPPTKQALSESMLMARVSHNADAPRPASASQLVRRQLEIASGTPRRRRFSLRYGFRNRTGPEEPVLFHYEPSSKEFERGDVEKSVRLSRVAHGDITL